MNYPASWHRDYGNKTAESARRILPALLEGFAVSSMVEVGCGQGHWSAVSGQLGVADIHAVDGPWSKPEELLVPADSFQMVDLSSPHSFGRNFDLALCLEVAEHVAESSAEGLVDTLTGAADVILFGAAIPYQGGHGHINERWPSWWRELFAARGFVPFDLVRPVHWDDQDIHYWYRQNCFVYVREAAAQRMAQAQRVAQSVAQSVGGAAPIAMFDAVHPEKFTTTASYQSIAFKRLVAALPGWAMRRLGLR